MTESALVSIIVPTYNREAFIPIAIDSVLSQTYKHFELIIINDGGTDNTKAVVDAYRLKDPRIHYLEQFNQGQSVARNYGLSIAKGDFICFLDSDNYWPADKLERSLLAFEHYPEADIVYGDCITIDEQGKELHRNNMRRYSGHIAAQLVKDNFVSMNTAMTRRICFDTLGGMSNGRMVADDYQLWLKFSTQFRFQYVPEYWAYYRVMENQISTNKKLRFDTNEKIIKNFFTAYPHVLTEKEKKAGLCAFYSRKARHYAAQDKREAYQAIKMALKTDVFSWSAWRTAIRVLLG